MPKLGYKPSQEHIEKRKGIKHWNWQGGKSLINPRKYHANKLKIWKKNNKDRIQHYNFLRHKRLSGVNGSFTLGEWKNLKAQYNWTCPWCKKTEPDIILTKDHIVPISKGGSNNIENIQPLCQSCNSKKHDSIIEKF